jgi:hypothetical protein
MSRLLPIAFLIICLSLTSTVTEANRAGGPRLKFCDYILQIGLQNPHCPPSGMGRSTKTRDQEESTTEAPTDATEKSDDENMTKKTREFIPHHVLLQFEKRRFSSRLQVLLLKIQSKQLSTVRLLRF